MVKLLTCDSYFELFPTFTKLIKPTLNNIEKKNVVFCEAKISLMIERYLSAVSGGTFNTDVYSFGKYLAVKNPHTNAVSKEGAVMAIKRILNTLRLNALKNSKANLSSTLYDLIIQLKSAKITPELLNLAVERMENCSLKNKLSDVALIFTEYEKFLNNICAEDQSSLLSYLPDVINTDEEIENSDVYLIGYSSFTAQAREAVFALMEKALSVTAVLTDGNNAQVFVNETSEFILKACKERGYPISVERVKSSYTNEGERIINHMFTPVFDAQKVDGNIYSLTAANPPAEVERVAEIIKGKVMRGECRYRDITVAIPEESGYGSLISSAFELLDIPYFLDEKKSAVNHPLITLILSYIDAKRKNFERGTLSTFYKNPLFSGDKNLLDAFENYCIKYNINYGMIKKPFTIGEQEESNFSSFERIRQRVWEVFETFDIKKMLSTLGVEETLVNLSEQLKIAGEEEESATNSQIYSATNKILEEMDIYLGGVEMTLSEYKNVFLSGINALELSIIPQYNDAVFIGNFKETALAKAKDLFVLGLTDNVPQIRQDVALLSDGDIDALEEIKVKLEPKIKVVNHRTRENVALALGAFTEGLYISYSHSAIDGKENVKSEVFTTIEKLFNTKNFPEGDRYLTERQGKKSFAYTIGAFAEGLVDNIETASDYYAAVGETKLLSVLNNANKEIKFRLNTEGRQIGIGETSPTTIEDYFKCPYRAFLSRTLKLSRREEGKVDPLSVGNLVHDIMRLYALNIGEVKDLDSSNRLFERVKEKIISKKEYCKFVLDPTTKAGLLRVLSECKKYCYKTFLALKNSTFKVREKGTEVAFGSGGLLPAIPLDNGNIKLKGKIDRIDETENYFRIVDYKTGNIEGTDQALFYGQELQLYLYAVAVALSEGYDKKLAGLYYLPISDKYMKEEDKDKPLAKGKTLDEKQAVLAQDKEFFEQGKSQFLPIEEGKEGEIKNAFSDEILSSYVKYALKVSDLAAKRIGEGVIVPSPAEKACDNCDYKAMCDNVNVKRRKYKKVSSDTVLKAVTEGEEYGKTN